MTNDEAIKNALDLNEAYKRSLCTARKCIGKGVYLHPVVAVELKKYEMAANDALEDALQFVPKDVLHQLGTALGPRRRFRLLTWRWRFIFKYDDETERLLSLHRTWAQRSGLKTI